MSRDDEIQTGLDGGPAEVLEDGPGPDGSGRLASARASTAPDRRRDNVASCTFSVGSVYAT